LSQLKTNIHEYQEKTERTLIYYLIKFNQMFYHIINKLNRLNIGNEAK